MEIVRSWSKGRNGAVAGVSLALIGGSSSALLVGLASGSAGAVGATITVDTLADGAAQPADCTVPIYGECSLRDAIAASSDGDTIVFDPALSGTITMSGGALAVDHGLIIDGRAAALITIDAGGAASVFDLCSTLPSQIELANITVTGTNLHGSAIDDQGCSLLTLRSVIVTGNRGFNVDGGGLHQHDPASRLVIVDSLFEDNAAVGRSGGAIYARGAVEIHGSDFSSNRGYLYGGAILWNSPDTSHHLEITDSTFDSNGVAYGNGGAIYAWESGGGTISISGSSFSGNYAQQDGGAVKFSGRMIASIADSTFTSNTTFYGDGGAVHLELSGQDQGSTITGSTFAANFADRGGAICIGGYMAPTLIGNSTFTENSAGAGGAIRAIWGDLTVAQTTIVGNHATDTNPYQPMGGGGIVFSPGISTVTLSGAIVAGNDAVLGPADIGFNRLQQDPAVVSSDGSVIGEVDPDIGITTSSTNLLGVADPGVGDLADNGGPTLTMALGLDSPARDAGPTSVAEFPGNLYDQRGVGFARVIGGRVDAGAFEVQSVPPPDPAPVVPTFTG